MVTTIQFFSKNVLCDRYNLLKYNENVDLSDIIYSESGDAFNGFDNPFIVNVSYDIIKDCRLCAVTIPNFNNGNRIFCLINDIKIIRTNKCAVYIEVDAWMFYRTVFDVGNDNSLYQTTAITDYAYHDFSAEYKVLSRLQAIKSCEKLNILIMYHESSTNSDVIYLIQSPLSFFIFYTVALSTFFTDNNIDTNGITAVYLSPFDVDTTLWNIVNDDSSYQAYKFNYPAFINLQDGKYSNGQYVINVKIPINIISDYKTKTVITDMNGAIVWQSERKDNGLRFLYGRLDITYDRCAWLFAITNQLTREIQESPNLRFVINCVNLAFYLDYYQQYLNTQKNFNAELRKIQLDKQLLDGIGNTISSAVNMGTMAGLGGNVGVGAVSGAIGGLASTGISYYATMDYNKKLANIEDRQARLQYDTITASNDAFLSFLTGETEPSIFIMSIDNESLKSQTNLYNEPFLTYNCRIRPNDVKSLLRTDIPSYISGDFQFIKMNEKDAIQLNTRFKHGVNFVSWKGD